MVGTNNGNCINLSSWDGHVIVLLLWWAFPLCEEFPILVQQSMLVFVSSSGCNIVAEFHDPFDEFICHLLFLLYPRPVDVTKHILQTNDTCLEICDLDDCRLQLLTARIAQLLLSFSGLSRLEPTHFTIHRLHRSLQRQQEGRRCVLPTVQHLIDSSN